MSNRVSCSPRDLSLLRLLSWTPAPTTLLQRASSSFEGGPFADERRLRERLQALTDAGFVRSWPMAQAGGGLQNYYKLTPTGFAVLHGPDVQRPGQAYFAEVSPTFFAHTFRLAELIVEMMRACHGKRVTIERFIRENELALVAGDQQVQPDCFFRLLTAGRGFNLAFEIDNGTASVDSLAANAIRQKLTTYHAYQELVLSRWLAGGKNWERPRFRVVFLTTTVERAYHILQLAAQSTRHRTRHLIYAAGFDSFVADGDPLQAPIFLDHCGNWHALVDLHPKAPFVKAPIRWSRRVESPLLAC